MLLNRWFAGQSASVRKRLMGAALVLMLLLLIVVPALAECGSGMCTCPGC